MVRPKTDITHPQTSGCCAGQHHPGRTRAPDHNRKEHTTVTTPNPIDTLKAGYAASTTPDRVAQSAAASWQPSADMEQLIALRASDPAFYNGLPAQRKTAVGMYEGAKAAAANAGVDTAAALTAMQQGNAQQ